MADFFFEFISFRKMVSTVIIKFVYIIGVLVLTIGGLAGLTKHFGIGLATLVLGNLLWRISCEGLILLFNIHQELVKISHSSKI